MWRVEILSNPQQFHFETVWEVQEVQEQKSC